MLREQLQAALKDAVEHGEEIAAATLRLVLTAVKERDHGLKESGEGAGLSDAQILQILRDMVAQRRSEIGRCESCAQLDLAEREAQEIQILSRFLPPRMSDTQIEDAVEEVIGTLGVTRLKDAGRVMASLKERFNGRMDFSSAKRVVCARLH